MIASRIFILLPVLWIKTYGNVAEERNNTNSFTQRIAESDVIKPFRVIWLHPDKCEPSWPLNLGYYGIESNSYRVNTVIGDKVKLFYSWLGAWPYMHDETPIHGGIPQRVSDYHYNKTRTDLMKIGGSDFEGLAILDYEQWRPLYFTNFGSLNVYQRQSQTWTEQQNISYTNFKSEVEKQFDESARTVFTRTLSVCQEAMPKAHWGYYLFPRTWLGDADTRKINNKLDWLYRQSTGLYPSIYLGSRNWVIDVLKEALRVQATFSPPNTPIYAFSLIQRGTSNFYNESDLDLAIGIPAKMGLDGVIIWGSSWWYGNAKDQCTKTKTYVTDHLGPYVQHLTGFMATCNTQVCNDHGRCIDKAFEGYIPNIPSSVYPGFEAENNTCSLRKETYSDYVCRCQKTWTGACCDKYQPEK